MATVSKQKTAAEKFAKSWAGRGSEKSDTHSFWLELVSKVFGVEDPYSYIIFEKSVKYYSTDWIDVYIPATHVLIEQKSIGIDMSKQYKQSDDAFLTPYEQAKRYGDTLGYDERPRWIIACNFAEFWIYDMSKQGVIEPEKIQLKDLGKEYHRLQFLVDSAAANIAHEDEVSFKAGELIGRIYDAFLKEYKDPSDPEVLKSLNKLCVRLVFCLYAEDTGVFPYRNQFHDYLAKFPVDQMRRALIDLFKILDTPDDKRDKYLTPDLADFPYVNGGLFSGSDIEIPLFTEPLKDLLLEHASLKFDWSAINPTIFGAVFESTLNPETRRKNGMHYTSIENIHKVIDPLFLDKLWEEFDRIKDNGNVGYRNRDLKAFKTRLSKLTFLDPACGSGNFLTETYQSLRRLENECLKLLNKGQMQLDVEGVIEVSIQQFYGIEYNDFAVNVAKTALWIAEFQMMQETAKIVVPDSEFLPLKTYTNIVEGNALRIRWEDVVPKDRLTYIMGNPPFLGNTLQTKEQKEDMCLIFKNRTGTGNLDYVSAWYQKAAEFIQGTKCECAFVSTNSITQGEQVATLWEPLTEQEHITISFAYKSFKWENETKGMAAVHCVIIGFDAKGGRSLKCIYAPDKTKVFARNISPYVMDMETIYVHKNKHPVSADAPKMVKGSIPVDGGNLIIEDCDYTEFIRKTPESKEFIRPLVGSEEFINNKKRWCLWLVDVAPNILAKMPGVLERINKVKEFRLASKKEATRKYAQFPTKFMEIRQPNSPYIIVPRVSSENREYVPIGFVNPNIISSDGNLMVLDATKYHFGILTSSVHMAWMRAVCGRLETRYRYSADIVYNNFPWPSPSADQRAAIESAAQAVLDARAKYPESSLADLYDPLTMPPDLRKAHTALDQAVMKAYGLKAENESEIVAFLMQKYRELTAEKK